MKANQNTISYTNSQLDKLNNDFDNMLIEQNIDRYSDEYYILAQEFSDMIEKGVTELQLIERGGNVWEKGSIKRIYLDNDSIAKSFNLKLDDTATYKGQFKSINKAKVWFNCSTRTLHSDKGLVRSMFNSNGIKCSK